MFAFTTRLLMMLDSSNLDLKLCKSSAQLLADLSQPVPRTRLLAPLHTHTHTASRWTTICRFLRKPVDKSDADSVTHSLIIPNNRYPANTGSQTKATHSSIPEFTISVHIPWQALVSN